MTRTRTDAVAAVLEVVALCKRRLPGLVVTFEPGWERRGNGLSAKYRGGSVHHTASSSSASRPFPTQRLLVEGRPDLSGPLTNFAGPYCTIKAPRLHVTAAHPANHAGASGGRSMGPLPTTSLFNPVVMGLEVDYSGTARMSAGQYLVATVWAGAVDEVVDGDGTVAVVRGHAETSITGKWDPGYALGKTIDLDQFRRDAARTLTEDLMAITDEDAAKIASALLRADASQEKGTQPLGDVVSQTWRAADRIEDAAARIEKALTALPAQISDGVARSVQGALGNGTVNVNAQVDPEAIGAAVGAEIARRLAG